MSQVPELKQLVEALYEADYDSPEFHAAAKSLSTALQQDGAAVDTLHALVKSGPLFDGDVPSKSGRDALVALGLATRNIIVRGQQGYQAATSAGWYVCRAGQP